MQRPPLPNQLLLWIDAVGGYLICLKPRLTIGQAGAEAAPDLAIQADIARHHATLQRDAENYYLEAVNNCRKDLKSVPKSCQVAINGNELDRAFLQSGDRFTLSTACQLLFTQPVPVSGSARLELVSGQRWRHPVQAVILMAETLVIGPGPQAHVIVDELKESMILFRPKSGLALRYGGDPAINGPIIPGARIVTEAVSFTLDAVN